MNIDYKKITNVEIEDIFRFDYPDFCDAFITAADYDGKPMSEEMIDYLNENDNGFIGETIFDKQLYL
jgi:hypothetical protein